MVTLRSKPLLGSIFLIAGDIGSMGVGNPPEPDASPSLLCQFLSISAADSSSSGFIFDSRSIDLERFDCACSNTGGFSALGVVEPYPRNLAKCFFLGEVLLPVTGTEDSGVVGADLMLAADSFIFCSLAKVLLSGA